MNDKEDVVENIFENEKKEKSEVFLNDEWDNI